jgi:arylsulfatase A-like enzyme
MESWDEGITRRRFLQATAAGAAGIALGADGSSRAAASSPPRPNIILITTDEQRFDALGCAGNQAIQTPVLDWIAAQGVRFARTYCQGPLCQPSRASLITGHYVHQHGQTWNRVTMNPEWPTMMKQLQTVGYHTACFGKTHFWAKPPVRSLDLRDNADFVRSLGFDDVVEEYDKHVHLHPGLSTPYIDCLKSKDLLEVYLEETPEFN